MAPLQFIYPVFSLNSKNFLDFRHHINLLPGEELDVLVVLEFPQGYSKDDMKIHMEAIYKELNPLAHEIQQIEYAIKGAIPAIDEVVEQHKDKMLIYTA